MKRAALVVTILFALLAFGCGFVGTTAALDITRPAVSGSTATVRFVVNDGDTSSDIANKLEKAGLIRNATIFRLLARYKHLDSGLKKGAYSLNFGMSMEQIIATLLAAPINEQQVVTVPPGLRITQYPKYFAQLPKFNADNFLKIATSGKLLDSAQTPLWTKYWFVQQPGKQVKYALEGYLFPDTYDFEKTADETTAVETMLENLAVQLCPGPDSNRKAYIATKDACKAHPAKVGSTDLFSAMEKAYSTKDDVAALHDVMTLASLTSRELDGRSPDVPGVTNVYYTRYMAILGNTPNDGAIYSLGSDPSADYALDNKAAPKDGVWWAQLAKLQVAGASVATTDPYNTDVVTNPPTALPPGPISAPIWAEIAAAANPGISKYFYFVGCKSGVYYATTLDQNNANNQAHCS